MSERMVDIRTQVLLAPYTTFKVGGPAEYFAVAKNVEEINQLVRFANKHHLPVFMLGGGSNVVIADQGIAGLVIKNEIGGISYESLDDSEVLVTAGSGVVWDDLVKETVERGLWGLENLSAIPGNVGATPVQNVGAYGVEAGDLIDSVGAMNLKTGENKIFSTSECQFGYRDSFFKTPAGKDYAITSVTYRLKQEPSPRLHYKDLDERFKDNPTPPTSLIREAVMAIRQAKFPNLNEVGTAGSFFKNPIITRTHYEELLQIYPELPGFEQSDGKIKIPLGWVLDKVCALRGYREGRVGAYAKQALVLINYGGASATEVDEFAKTIAEKVFSKTKIMIEREVNFVGDHS